MLNPASGRTPDGALYLLPRLVATGNVSRVGLAEILVRPGRTRPGCGATALCSRPMRAGRGPRPRRGRRPARHVDPEPRPARHELCGLRAARTEVGGGGIRDLRSWRRLGPIHFEYQPDLDTDLNLFTNKDVVYFPEPIPGPDGRPAYRRAAPADVGARRDHRWPRVSCRRPGDPRPGIWISYTPADAVLKDVRALTHVRSHRLVALPEYDYEAVKIGAGPPPLRVERGGCSSITASRERWPRAGARNVTCGTAPGRCCSTRMIPAPSWPAALARCSNRWHHQNAKAPCRTWCSRRPSRRSTGSGSSSTEWPTPASESPA